MSIFIEMPDGQSVNFPIFFDMERVTEILQRRLTAQEAQTYVEQLQIYEGDLPSGKQVRIATGSNSDIGALFHRVDAAYATNIRKIDASSLAPLREGRLIELSKRARENIWSFARQLVFPPLVLFCGGLILYWIARGFGRT